MSPALTPEEKPRYITHIAQDILNDGDEAIDLSVLVQKTSERLSNTDIQNVDDSEIRAEITDNAATRKDSFGDTTVENVTPIGSPPEEIATSTSANTEGALEYNPRVQEIPVTRGPEDGEEDDSKKADFTTLTGVELSANKRDVLHEEGIKSFMDLATTTPERILNITGFSHKPLAYSLITSAQDEVGEDLIARDVKENADTFLEEHEDSIATVHQAAEIKQPVGEPTGRHFCGLPVLEDAGHPLADSLEELPPYYARDISHSDAETLTQDQTNKENNEKDIEVVAKLLAKDRFVPNLVGHAGVGKSLIGKTIAAIINQPSITFNMDGDMRTADVFGIHHLEDENGNSIDTDEEAEQLMQDDDRSANNVTTVWKDGPLTRAVRYGWFVIFDEINGAPPRVTIALHSLFEENGHLHLKEANEIIEPHAQFRAVTTMNPPTSRYGGTNELNNAFQNRLTNVKIDWLPKDKEVEMYEETINKPYPVFTPTELEDLVSIANRFREEAESDINCPHITPRDIKRIADIYYGSPMTIHDAFRIFLEGRLVSPRQSPESYIELVNDAMQTTGGS
jgi:MoxR-like ATPase